MLSDFLSKKSGKWGADKFNPSYEVVGYLHVNIAWDPVMMQALSYAPLWMMLQWMIWMMLHTDCSEDRRGILSASEGTKMMRPDMQCQQI
jgi:hypothetical protein